MTIRSALCRAISASIAGVAIALTLVLPGQFVASGPVHHDMRSIGSTAVTMHVVKTAYPVGDCAVLAGSAAVAVGGILSSEAGGAIASTANIWFSRAAVALHSAMTAVLIATYDHGKECVQYNGNAGATAICNASHFSAWDPRGIAARTIVRLVTAGDTTRC